MPVADSINLMFFLLRPQMSCCIDRSMCIASIIRPNWSQVSKCPVWDSVGIIASNPYPLINGDKDSSLRVFRRQDVTIDGNSPTLVPSNLDIAIHTINKRGQLRAEQKDIDTAEGRYVVESLSHSLLQGASIEVGDHVTIDVNCGAALMCEVNG